MPPGSVKGSLMRRVWAYLPEASICGDALVGCAIRFDLLKQVIRAGRAGMCRDTEAPRAVNPMVKRFNLADEFSIPEGCHIIEMSNSPDDPDVSIARARVRPGVTTRWHRLRDTTERYVMLEGEGAVEIDDLPAQSVTVGDVVLIPPMSRQRIMNTGSSDLVFLAVCSPPFNEKNYEEV